MSTKIISPYSPKDEKRLMTELWDPQLSEDPEKFVMFVYPWGKKNTPLEKFKGPRTWQRDELQKMTAHIKEQKNKIIKREEVRAFWEPRVSPLELDKKMEPYQPTVYQSAICSGRGVGKSSFTAWINHWMLSTQLGATCIATANTESQLRTRTWAEVGKWHTLSINAHWFERTAMSLRPVEWFEKELKTQLKIDTGYYYAQAQLWSEENPDSFAGSHSQYGMLLVFDEASGIPQPIWTVSEGFFTEPVLHRYHFVFSNPRRNTGAFYECFHKHRNFWRRRNLDSREVEGTDKALLNKIIEKYGEDSDEARVEVKGQFPRTGDHQFISREIISQAVQRELVEDLMAPLIMGIDIARFGVDKTVFRWRRGRDARSIPPVEIKSMDNMQVADLAAEWIDKTDPDAVCIDAGNGTGVIDRLRQMRYKVHEVWFGGQSDKDQWFNKKTQMWDDMREWLKGGAIDSHQELIDDLAGPQYKFVGNSDKIRLENKDEMKARGLASPDHGDSLACTFAVRVPRLDLKTRMRNRVRVADGVDYDVFGN